MEEEHMSEENCREANLGGTTSSLHRQSSRQNDTSMVKRLPGSVFVGEKSEKLDTDPSVQSQAVPNCF